MQSDSRPGTHCVLSLLRREQWGRTPAFCSVMPSCALLLHGSALTSVALGASSLAVAMNSRLSKGREVGIVWLLEAPRQGPQGGFAP